jgi:hypothetical protein
MSTINSYLVDILDNYSGVQAVSAASIGSRCKNLSTAGTAATGYMIQPWDGMHLGAATHTATEGVTTAAEARLSTAYTYHFLATVAANYLLPYPYPGLRIVINAQRSSDVCIWTDIGTGTTPVVYYWSSFTTRTSLTGTGAGPLYFEFIGRTTAIWQLMLNATGTVTGSTGCTGIA